MPWATSTWAKQQHRSLRNTSEPQQRVNGSSPMKRSTDRILTTHAGRLDGPAELMQITRDLITGRQVDLETLKLQTGRGIVDVVRKQVHAGIDIISDGELSKFGFGGLAYYGRRLSGLATRPLKPGEAPFMALETNERIEFADFYKDLQFLPAPSERAVCSGPVAYIGQEEVERDIQLFKSALAEANVGASEAFM